MAAVAASFGECRIGRGAVAPSYAGQSQPAADDPGCQAAIDRPQSIAELARLTNRAEPNLLRTLGKLEAFGFLAIRTIDRRRVPTVMVDRLRIEIDPRAMTDRIETSPAHG